MRHPELVEGRRMVRQAHHDALVSLLQCIRGACEVFLYSETFCESLEEGGFACPKLPLEQDSERNSGDGSGKRAPRG